MTSAVELGGTPSDALICGTAVTTIVPSRISMKKHAATRSATLRSRLSIIGPRSKARRGYCGHDVHRDRARRRRLGRTQPDVRDRPGDLRPCPEPDPRLLAPPRRVRGVATAQ